ncbi:MAG TPA: cation:proton antiporter, partial [Petrotogaceae bacterium]|nr:cation:proton antiporter [Petrotogaceae bacterium]
MDNLFVVLLIFSLMLILSIFSSKISSKIGLPLILLFMVIGMLWGSDGPGGIYFDDPYLAQYISTVALIFILFSGGLDTEYKAIRPVLKEGILLSTIAVAITALITGLFASIIFKLPLKAGLLIGSIVSSTDAAAVFSVLRSKKISLKGNLKPLLELESGSNDPMAILLTMAFTMINTGGNMTGWGFFLFFTQQILLGLICGFILGKLSLRVINRLTLDYEGLYLVLIIAFTILIYSVT